MQLVSNNFKNGYPIPEEFTFGKKDPTSHVAFSTRQNDRPEFARRKSARRR
jgi:hypothetical protein